MLSKLASEGLQTNLKQRGHLCRQFSPDKLRALDSRYRMAEPYQLGCSSFTFHIVASKFYPRFSSHTDLAPIHVLKFQLQGVGETEFCSKTWPAHIARYLFLFNLLLSNMQCCWLGEVI